MLTRTFQSLEPVTNILIIKIIKNVKDIKHMGFVHGEKILHKASTRGKKDTKIATLIKNKFKKAFFLHHFAVEASLNPAHSLSFRHLEVLAETQQQKHRVQSSAGQ